MNFNDLYNLAFVTEQNEQDIPASTAPSPDGYEVEPLPLPKPNNDVETLNSYIADLNDFLNTLNGIGGRSLQQFVNDVDKQNSLLEGISDTSSDITKLAESTASLVQTLQAYVTGVNKRKRELALSVASR